LHRQNVLLLLLFRHQFDCQIPAVAPGIGGGEGMCATTGFFRSAVNWSMKLAPAVALIVRGNIMP
jgi:hypothetical protein